jgi:hypothetical protein
MVERLYHVAGGRAASKPFYKCLAPEISSCYIGWLSAILLRMTGRYRLRHLEGLAGEDALAAVYNYAATYRVAVTESTASYLAEACDHDPFYIAATISNRPDEKDLTTQEGVLDALTLETVMGKGEVAQMWRDYLLDAFARVNDVNARKIVLYLARHDPEERDRDQIREDLELEMTDIELESLAGASLDDIAVGDVPDGLTLDRFTTICKGRPHFDLETSVEIDLHAVSEKDDGTDLVVEVKDWERPLTHDAAAAFAETKEKLAPLLARRTAFLLYSESGVSPEASVALAEAGVLVVDVDKLAGYEMPSRRF